MENSCCGDKTRVRSAEELKKLSNRLCRIEGQVRGLREMLQISRETWQLVKEEW